MLLNSYATERAAAGEALVYYQDQVNPTVANLVMEPLDAERVAVGKALGLRHVLTFGEWSAACFGHAAGSIRETVASNPSYAGFGAPHHLLALGFVDDEVPNSLVPLVELGRLVGVPTPMTDSHRSTSPPRCCASTSGAAAARSTRLGLGGLDRDGAPPPRQHRAHRACRSESETRWPAPRARSSRPPISPSRRTPPREVWAEATQADVDRVTQAMADAGHEAAAHLAEMAHAETGYGRVDHKTFKNIFCTRRYLDQIRHIPTVGVIASYPERGVTEIAEPVGVVAGLVPVTNPTVDDALLRHRLRAGAQRGRQRRAPARREDDRRDGADPRRGGDRRRRAAEPGHGHDRGVARGHPGADGALPHRPGAGHRLAADGARGVLVGQADVRRSGPATRRPGCTGRAPTWARPRPASSPRRRSTTARPARRSRP